jgi:signal transduction histidine kinase
VSSLYVDRKGTLWAGTDNGLDRFDPKGLRFAHFRPKAPGLPRYHQIKEDQYGMLWLASWGTGLHRFDPATGSFVAYAHQAGKANSLSNDRVNSVCVDREGLVWAGTSNGLNRFDPKSGAFRAFYERDGLPDNNVLAILEDERGNLWMGTGNGLSRYDRNSNAFRNFFVEDGLPGDQFSFFPAASRSAGGEMFFGLTSGAISFFPERLVENTTPPPVVLTDFRLFGAAVTIGHGSALDESVSTTASLTLPPFQNTFSFQFAALSFRSPARNRYRFRLEPQESRWNETSSDRPFTTYTTVAPGDYVFRVQASDARGIWNEIGAGVRIRIQPPWWRTWWFRALFSAALLVLMRAAYRYRLHQMAREFKAQLEGRVDERLRVARDLHDTLLQSFHGLLLRFQAVQNLLPARVADAQKVLQAAVDDAARAITEARDAVQELRSSAVTTNDLVQAIETVGQELAAHERCTQEDATAFAVEVSGKPQDLHPILRDEIYRIAREALRNAFLHARARRIEAEIRYEPRQLRLLVRDDGIGIDPGVLRQDGRPGHWGLKGMRERAKGIGAQLDVWSEHGAGTEVELTLPASTAYNSSTRRPFRLFKSKVGMNS